MIASGFSTPISTRPHKNKASSLASPPHSFFKDKTRFNMKITIENEDGTQEIEVSPEQVSLEDSDPFVTQDTVDKAVESRLARERKQLPEKLKKDDDFFAKAAKERGIELREDGLPKGTTNDTELRELRKKASRAEELEQELSRKNEVLQSTRTKTLESQIRAAAPDLEEDTADVFLDYASKQFTFDQEVGDFVQKEGSDIRFKGSEPVKVDTFVEEMKQEKPTFFKNGKATGGPDVSASSSGKTTYTQQEWESKLNNAAELSQEEYDDLMKADEEGRVV